MSKFLHFAVNMGVTTISEVEDFEKILNDAGDKLVVVDFFAEWCGPCRMIGPKFEKMSDEFSDIIFLKVDVDEVEEVAENYDVSAMPNFVFIKNGRQVNINSYK